MKVYQVTIVQSSTTLDASMLACPTWNYYSDIWTQCNLSVEIFPFFIFSAKFLCNWEVETIIVHATA